MRPPRGRTVLRSRRSAIRPRAVFLAASLLAGAAFLGCSEGDGGRERQEAATERPIEEVQEAHTPEWMEIPGVMGTGIGLCDDRPCIKVFVARRTPEIEEKIPERVEGYRIRIEVTGEFRAQDSSGV